ncbi:hypothetical protein [Peribacillus simplex]
MWKDICIRLKRTRKHCVSKAMCFLGRRCGLFQKNGTV